MDASQLFGTIIRILNQPVFPPRAKLAHAAKSHSVAGRSHGSVRADAARPALPTGLAPITFSAASAPTPLAAATPAPATTQAQRTLEEVRADLARLRDQAKRRQAASAQARRERAFAPTDFMDFRQGAAAPEAAPPGRAFAPTDFMEIGSGKPS